VTSPSGTKKPLTMTRELRWRSSCTVRIERRRILVAVRVSDREHARWLKAAALEDLKLVELIREAVRAHVRDLKRLRLLGRGHVARAAGRVRDVEREAPNPPDAAA